MADQGDESMLLGRHTPLVREYAPHILHAIPRNRARSNLGLGEDLPFYGEDLWHAYEMSWLDDAGKPVVRIGRFSIPATSPNIIESKSFKLYLNSLNNTRFSGEDKALDTVVADLGKVAGEGIKLQLLAVDDPSLSGTNPPGTCLDNLGAETGSGNPGAALLHAHTDEIVEEVLYSHLLRSLCPVTGQPDWATVWLHYRGNAVEHSSLLRYILSYREHQEFHEQCVERMFCDISSRCAPEFLHIQACYTRRGGLDINPYRSTEPGGQPLARLIRQ